MKEATDYKGKIDFAIISIREDEYSAVLSRFPMKELSRGKNRLYSISEVELPDDEYYLVACAAAIEQGGGSAQDLARDMIEDLDPSMLLLVGIAGAVPDVEFTLGDVVIAKRLHDFSVGAAIEGRAFQLNQGGPMHKLVQDLLAALPALRKLLGDWNTPQKLGIERPSVDPRQRVYGDAEWIKRVTNSIHVHFDPAGARRSHPVVTARSVASGNVLMRDSRVLGDWLVRARELAAVEMELNGVYIASRRVEREYPVLAIRGISDVVGLERDPAWTEYACHSAASCAHAFIVSELLSPKSKTNAASIEELEPDSLAFEAFCHALRDRRVGRADEWGGEINIGSMIGSEISLPKRFLGFGTLVMQFIPASASLKPPRLVDLSRLRSHTEIFERIHSWTSYCDNIAGYSYNHYPVNRQRRNPDGFLLWSSKEREDDYAGHYVQFYSDGIVEAVDHRIMGQVLHSRVIPGQAVEKAITSVTLAVLDAYRELSVEGRIWTAVSIVNHVQYATISYDDQLSPGPARIGRQHRLLLPPFFLNIEDSVADVAKKLGTVFDALAHAGGWDGSPNSSSG